MLLPTGSIPAHALALAEEASDAPIRIVTDQVLLLATVVGAVAALPALIEFLLDRKKRRERIALSLDDEPVPSLDVRLAGLDDLLRDIDDLIDRAKNPEAYAGLSLGNELLILGPTLSGKKSLARRIAQLAGFDRVVTVYNTKNPDALAKAKALLAARRRAKILLLLPAIDQVFDDEDDETLAELDALIETASASPSVLIIGTARSLIPDSPLDATFGTKVLMPGTPRAVSALEARPSRSLEPGGAGNPTLPHVARFYLDRALRSGFVLEGMSPEEAMGTILAAATNPAEIEDIVVLWQTAGIHHGRMARAPRESPKPLTPALLRRAIDRVIVAVPPLSSAPPDTT